MKKSQRLTWKTLAASALLSAALLPSASAAEMPVDFTWDCLVNGSQGRGIAFLTFYGDNTFDGVQLMTVNRAPAPTGNDDETDPRGDAGESRGDDTNSGGGTPLPPTVGTENLYGIGEVFGRWNYDAKGKVLGHFQQVLVTGQGTNQIAVTNAVGFKAIVTGTRLTLVASTPGRGKSTYTGVLMRDLPDLSGSWYANQRGTGQKLVDFFELVPTWRPGIYDVFGSGANYTFSGQAMLSSRKRIGFALSNVEDGVMRANVGMFYPGKGKALTTGFMEPDSRIRFDAFRLSTFQ